MVVFFVESFLCIFNEFSVQIVANQIDGTAAKATSHDARASDAILLGNVVKEV